MLVSLYSLHLNKEIETYRTYKFFFSMKFFIFHKSKLSFLILNFKNMNNLIY